MLTLSSVLSTYLCKNWDKWLILINNPLAISERAENIDVNTATWNTTVWSLPSNGSPSSLWRNAVSTSRLLWPPLGVLTVHSLFLYQDLPHSRPRLLIGSGYFWAKSFPYKYPNNLILFFIVFYPCNIYYIFIFQQIALNWYFFYKQHIKIFELSKTLITSPTCFGHYLAIIREILYLS